MTILRYKARTLTSYLTESASDKKKRSISTASIGSDNSLLSITDKDQSVTVEKKRNILANMIGLGKQFGFAGQMLGDFEKLLFHYARSMQSDECPERITCELGVRAQPVPMKDVVFK